MIDPVKKIKQIDLFDELIDLSSLPLFNKKLTNKN